MLKLIRAAALLPLLATPVAAEQAGPELTLSDGSAVLRVSGYVVEVEQVRMLEAGGMVLSGATLTRPGRDGYLIARQVELSDPKLLTRLLDPTADCDPSAAGSGQMVARDVRFRPDPDLGVPGLREEIRVPALRLETALIGCSWQVRAEAEAIRITGVDGSRLDVIGAEARLRLSGPQMRALDLRVDLFGLDLIGVDGPAGLRMGEAGFSLVADLTDGGLISLIRSGSPDLLASIPETVVRAGVYVRDLDLIPDLFLPERDLLRTGLEETGQITGDMELSLGLDRGDGRVRASYELSGIGSGELSVNLTVPGATTLRIPEAISASVPVPSELIGVSVSRASLSYRDGGGAEILRRVSGRGPEELAQSLIGGRVERVSSRLPGGLSATVTAAWGAVIKIVSDGTGSAGLRPDQPFTLLDLAVSGMMGPGFAATRTGAYTGD